MLSYLGGDEPPNRLTHGCCPRFHSGFYGNRHQLAQNKVRALRHLLIPRHLQTLFVHHLLPWKQMQKRPTSTPINFFLLSKFFFFFTNTKAVHGFFLLSQIFEIVHLMCFDLFVKSLYSGAFCIILKFLFNKLTCSTYLIKSLSIGIQRWNSVLGLGMWLEEKQYMSCHPF